MMPTSEPINELMSWPGRRIPARDLMYDAKMAVAWGRRDSESTGYSADEFINIIQKLVKRIEELERQLDKLAESA